MIAKYKLSKIDNKEYCVTNGQFTRHLLKNGYSKEDYKILFELGYTPLCQFCLSKRSFKEQSNTFNKGCGNFNCRGKNISLALSKYTEKDWHNKTSKFKNTQRLKSKELLENEKDKALKSLRNTIAENKEKIVQKRRSTCLKKYGCETYNNSQQISETKKSFDRTKKTIIENKRNATLKERYGVESLSDFLTDKVFEKRRATLEHMGVIAKLDELSEWEIYKKTVRNLTEKTFRKHFHNIKRSELRGLGYELDHIIPVFEGFLRGIDCGVIASVRNLRIITKGENRKRKRRLDDNEFERLYKKLCR